MRAQSVTLSAIVLLGAVGPFGGGAAYYHPTAHAPYRFNDSRVALRFDIPRRTIYGDEVVVVRLKRNGMHTVPFDSAGIAFTRVTVNGRAAHFSVDSAKQRVDVALRHSVAAGVPIAIEFVYSARPQRGLFFVMPDGAYPAMTPEIWTQGEPTDNRRWFPTWDEPNEKTPSELIVTVPHGWTVVANGYLKAHVVKRNADTWDWRSPQPKSTYLIAFAAGPLVKHHTALGTLDVDSFVQSPYGNLNALCFGSTSRMIAFYNRLIGIAYPFAKYDQTTAERYVFGGMEDESAALITVLALHPKIEDVESGCDQLVSHELAQNWWGDDVTMADWSNVWINEGFATYYDELWTQHRFGEAAFEYARYEAQQSYFDETKRYLRPIVDYDYADPLDMFDASGHERPAEILHMLRVMFGDRRFFGALRSYLHRYTFRNADTQQFFAAMETYLHTDLRWFERQWFYRRDYPHFVVTDNYSPQARRLTLKVEQRNVDGRPYRVRIVVEAHADGTVVRRSFVVDRNDQILTLDGMKRQPQMVLFDPNHNVLAELTFQKPVEQLAYQLDNAAHVGDREWALAQLAAYAATSSQDRAQAESAVERAAAADRFYGVRADAVRAAAAFQDDAAVARALHDADVRVRLSAEGAAPVLATRASRSTLDALHTLTADDDPNVAAEALAALGALHAPAAYELLVSALDRPSFRQTIAIGAIQGLAAYGDARALPLLLNRTQYGAEDQERNAAAIALAKLAKAVDRASNALPVLENVVQHDPVTGMRIAAARALGILGDRAALPALEAVASSDSQTLVRSAARDAALTLSEP